MPTRPEPRVAALVLAAGASTRYGSPKQLLQYGDGVLLDAVLATVRASSLDQIVVTLGGAAAQVRKIVDTTGCDVVENLDFRSGCSSSIGSSLPALGPGTDVLVLLLGDQPGVRPESVRSLLKGRGDAAIAVCRYDDGIGHPFAFSSSTFADLAGLHGDKGVWRLLDQRAAEVAEVPVLGRIPVDIDTEEDYDRVLAELRGAR